MQLNPKSIGLLSLLVVSIYVMRDGGLSFTTPVSRTVFRRLYDYARPDSTTCSGVSLTETFSEGDLNRAKNLQESLKSVRGGNPLEEVLMGGKVDGDKFLDYAMGMIASVAVWAAFFVLSIICCCCGCCNWCCMFGCCKGCKCCKCCKKPQTAGKKKKVYAIVSLVFMLALFSAGIAGAAFSGSIPNGMKVSYCAILSMVEDLAYGRQADKWLGLKGVIVSLGDILVSFDTTINGLSTTSSTSFTNMNNAYTTASQAVTDYYNNHNALTLTRPDPAQSSSSSYKPDWVNNLGPIATSGKYLYAIQQEMDVKRDTLNNAQTDINNAITDVKAQQGDIKSSLESGRDSANDIFASVEDAIKSLNDAGDLVNTVVQIIGKVILAIFIVYIVIALLPIISILLIHFLKIKFFSKIMHFSWCIMGFLAIIGFLICAIFYPISIIFTEFCGVFTNALSDGAYFNQTIGSAMGDGQAKDLTYLCMFGNGAALEQLGVNDSVSHFDTIYTQLDEVNKTLNFSSPNPVPSTTIPYAKWLLQSFRDGYMPDSTTLTDDLATLNALTNKNSNGCTPNQDTWITSTVNCTTSEGANFTGSSAATYDQPNPSCIGMDVWASNSGNSGSNRYTLTQFPSSCATKNGGQTQLAYVQQFADNLKTQRTASKTLFTNLLTDFTATGGIEDAEADFGGYAYDCLSPFSTIKAQLSGIEASLTGPESGVIPNTRCQFIGTGMKTFANALCIGFVASIYQATVVLIIVSMFSFFGAICVMCAAKRINVDDKDGDKHVAPDAYHEGKMVN